MARGDGTEFDRQYAEAVERGRRRAQMGPRARSVRYDRGTRRIVLELVSGVVLMVPVDLLEGLRGASDRELSSLELMPRGLDVHWRRLDAQFTVAGLMKGIFGTRTWMSELGRAGGSVKSRAKSAAARANGRLGGRPRRAREGRRLRAGTAA